MISRQKKQEVIDEQELLDYAYASKVMMKIFNNKITNIKQRERFSPSDCLFTAATDTKEGHYNLEIKSCKYADFNKYGTFILKKDKLQRILTDWEYRGDKAEKNIIIYLMKSANKYYVFNLDDINSENTTSRELYLNDCEVAPKRKVKTRCWLLKGEDAIAVGKIEDKHRC